MMPQRRAKYDLMMTKKIRLSSRKILQKPPEKSIRLKWANKPAVFAQSGNATNASLKRHPKLNAKVAESFCNYHVLNDKLSEGLVPDRHFALVKSKVHMCQNSERLHLCMG